MSEDTKPYQMSLFDFAPGGVDSTNLFVHAVMDAVPKKEETAVVKATEKPAKKLGRIEDFGAKIGGARKDVYAAYRDMMQMAIEKDVASMPLSKSWPAPNYGRLLASGMEPWKVHAVRALRDALPPKPGIHHFALGQWANRMSILRDIAVSVLDGTLDEEGLRQELLDFCGGRLSEDGGFKNGRQIWVEKVMDLRMAYEILGHEHSLSKMKLIERSETAEPDPNRRIELVETSGKYSYYEILHAPTKREAWETYRGMQEKRTGQHTEKTTKNPFGVYRWKGHEEYFIGRKLGKTWIEVASPFASSKEAFEYMASHLGELHEKYAELRQTPFERESQNAPRIGTARREDDVTPEQFADTFGFRGVEFGNWVENRKRQDDLNQAYDALMDLTKTLNLPPKVMSLSGSLSLAFGARGRGGKQAPSAHYEPARVVINLTKQSGAGSLAHEWLHAVDNYFARRSGGSPISMMTVGKGITCTRQELREAFQYLHKSINGTEFHKRSLKLDKRRKDTYWSQPEEMAARAFEAYIKDKLKEQGIRNDYLVNVREKSSWDGATDHSSGMEDTYPYPYGEEMKAIRESFDKLFAVIEYREHEGSLEVYSARGENISQMLADAKEVSPEEITDEERSLQVFSQEVLGIDLTFFQGAKELHGRYDRDCDRFYVNQDAEVSMDWVMWHEAFHAMKEHEPELYADLLCHAEKTEMFSKKMMDDYRKETERPCMSDSEVAEELLADAFADRKTGRRVLQDMAKANPTLVRRLVAFTQKILHSAKRLLHLQDSKETRKLQEKYPGVRLTDRQFRDFSERITENLCSLRDSKNQLMFISKGYRILAADGKVPEDSLPRLPKCKHSPFRYAPRKQKKCDQQAVQELLRHYPQEAVAWAVQTLSPLGERMGQYGKKMVENTLSWER